MFQMTCMMCICFFLAWTPYSIVSFVYLFHASHTVPHYAAVAAPFFAKSSTLYNPIIYFLAVKRFRADTWSLVLQWTSTRWHHCCCRFKLKNRRRRHCLAFSDFDSNAEGSGSEHTPSLQKSSKTASTSKVQLIVQHRRKDKDDSYELSVLKSINTKHRESGESDELKVLSLDEKLNKGDSTNENEDIYVL